MRGHIFKRCPCGPVRDEQGNRINCPKKHGSWSYHLTAGRTADHRRRQFTKGGFPTQREAQDALDDMRRRLGEGADIEGGKITVGGWLDQWLAEKSKREGASAAGRKIRATTTRSYEAHVRLYLRPALGHLALDKLRASHISAMFDGILAENADRERPVSAATMRKIFGTLRSALNTAVKQRRLSVNPCSYVELPSADRPKALVWTDERTAEWRRTGRRPSPVMVWTPTQTGAFLDSIEDDRLAPLYHLMAFRGLRRGEACGLGWADVDLDGGTLTVSWQLVQLGWAVEGGRPKSDAGARVVALDAATVAVLRAWRSRQSQERLALGAEWEDNGRVFTRVNGQELHPGYVSAHFDLLVTRSGEGTYKAADVRRLPGGWGWDCPCGANSAGLAASEKAARAEATRAHTWRSHGLPPIRLHDLRHGAATLALAAGADIKVVQEMLGHSSSALTADTYTSVVPELARDAAEAASRLVPRASRTPAG